ncbi:hypothetical protein K432DRAFT_173382 [Lepidopterella palustris CBS 459.81]|uniref:Uncharacterized protein n=1 Tax=Lepidopterella palustris CBS 459.81 TaxID=1314670 RepID=A0A8E2EGW4_9PEZI|nr:hypothetical protein K432DRAFT_173382 [Lepidopterella palustris CBS 459.81]
MQPLHYRGEQKRQKVSQSPYQSPTIFISPAFPCESVTNNPITRDRTQSKLYIDLGLIHCSSTTQKPRANPVRGSLNNRSQDHLPILVLLKASPCHPAPTLTHCSSALRFPWLEALNCGVSGHHHAPGERPPNYLTLTIQLLPSPSRFAE